MANPIIQTSNLERTFNALRNNNPEQVARQDIPTHKDYPKIPNRNHAPIATVEGFDNRIKTASAAGIVYGQPQFFSPVHTPINWQIPSKAIEERQWARFFYSNEPKVASAIDFYSYFPMSNWTHECKNIKVKKYFDKFKERLNLHKWLRLISHEIHLLGDCFPHIEISCEHCNGTGKIGSEICEHEGGTVSRIVILNPDYVEVYTSPLSPEPIIALKPDEELKNMVAKKLPGYDRLTPEVIKLISSGSSIRLDNRCISHLKYGECPYTSLGIGMVRRLFPILSYKTKLMVAQWIIAERLILPIKIVKVGSDERPAGPADIAAVQSQLAQTANDPNLTLVTHHNFELEYYGAAGKTLALSNEFEIINQEVLDGLMINNALLNGEGPTFSAAAVGIEAMIQRLETLREQISDWLINFIYKPEAIRQGYVEKDEETGEEEPIVPSIKWNKMQLRDSQQDKQFAMQLYEKGLLSAQTMLEIFGYDPDMEIERKRYDYVQMMALGQGFGGQQQQGGGMGGGGMGGMGGGGMGGGGGLDLGGLGGGEAPISAPGAAGPGEVGGAPASPIGGGESTPMGKTSTFDAEIADPNQFGGRVLKKKTRDKLLRDKKSTYKSNDPVDTPQDTIRDEKGRIVFTKPERELVSHIIKAQQDGILKYAITPQLRVNTTNAEYLIDFAITQLKIGIEADGEVFHSNPKQVTRDKERDSILAQSGWTILRFTDTEIEKRPQQVIGTIIKYVMQKEIAIKNFINKGQEEQGKIGKTGKTE